MSANFNRLFEKSSGPSASKEKCRLLNFLVTTLNKSLRTSPEPDFQLTQAFNWAKNNFGEKG